MNDLHSHARGQGPCRYLRLQRLLRQFVLDLLWLTANIVVEYVLFSPSSLASRELDQRWPRSSLTFMAYARLVFWLAPRAVFSSSVWTRRTCMQWAGFVGCCAVFSSICGRPQIPQCSSLPWFLTRPSFCVSRVLCYDSACGHSCRLARCCASRWGSAENCGGSAVAVRRTVVASCHRPWRTFSICSASSWTRLWRCFWCATSWFCRDVLITAESPQLQFIDEVQLSPLTAGGSKASRCS